MWQILGRFSSTLKLRIAMAAGLLVLCGVWASTAVTLGIVESAARDHLVAEQKDAAQRTASHLAQRVRDRRRMLAAFARRITPTMSVNASQSVGVLAAEPLSADWFRTTFIATPSGDITALAQNGSVSLNPMSIADRDYFRELLRTGQGVMSGPLISRVSDAPMVAMVEPVFDETHRLTSVVGATLALLGTEGLGADAARINPTTLTVVVDRTQGLVIGHPEARMLLRPATHVRELGPVLARLGARLRGDDLVGADGFGSLTIGWAAVEGTPWTVFEVSDTKDLTATLHYTRTVAIVANIALSLVAAALMLIVLIRRFEPLERLRERAVRLRSEPVDLDTGWPGGRDEVGELSRALQHLLRERAAAEADSLRTLGQLQAVLDTAPIGIAFSRNDCFEVASRSVTDLTGYGQGELFGKPISILQVSDHGWDRLKALIGSTGGRFDVEFPIRRKDRSTLWVRTLGRSIDVDRPEAGMVWIVEDATERRRLQEQLAWSAARDPLTELLNRRAFEAMLSAHLDDPERPPAALLLLDLDRFKAVNDVGGHGAGDRVLCDIARLIERQVRSADHVARLGGDEFAILLIGCTVDIAVSIAERIRASIRDHRLEHDGVTHSVGVSVGVVQVESASLQSVELIRAADQACYRAKHEGRDAVRVWERVAG